MYTKNYTEKRTFEKFDAGHYMLYLGEKAVKFVPEQHMPDDDDGVQKEVSGYSYTGDQPDGGTLIEAKNAEYGEFVAGLIALRYSQDAESAVHANSLLALNDATLPKAKQYKQEFVDYNAYRNECKQTAKTILGIQ
jgi:hypothetical protein